MNADVAAGGEEDADMVESVKTRPKLTLVSDKEYQGAVSAVDFMQTASNRYIVFAAGRQVPLLLREHLHYRARSRRARARQITMAKWKENELRICGFFDVDFYVTSLSVVKTYIFCSDMFKSCQLVWWNVRRECLRVDWVRTDVLEQEGKRSLTRLARDPHPSAVYATEFIVQDNTLGMVGGDAAGNVVVYNFMPRKVGASDELIPRADFHVGSMVRKMVRLVCTGRVADGAGFLVLPTAVSTTHAACRVQAGRSTRACDGWVCILRLYAVGWSFTRRCPQDAWTAVSAC